MQHLRAFRASIVANRLAYAHPDGTPLFGPLTFSLPEARYGLVGPNGAGKSTFLRLLAGELEPTAGTLQIPGSFGYLAQRDPNDPDALAVDDSGIERPYGSFSGGERIRLRLARLLAGKPQWLLLDEPTNHLDADAREALYSALDAWGGGLIVASHDRALLGRLDRIVELGSLGARVYGGSYAFYEAQRRTEEEAAGRALAAARSLLQAERGDRAACRGRARRTAAHGEARTLAQNVPKVVRGALKRKAQVSAGKSAATHEDRVERAKRELAAARELARREARICLDLAHTSVHASKIVARCQGLNATYPDGTRLWPCGLDLEIAGPARIAICGPNGSGKTTLLRMIAERATVPAAVLDQHLRFLPERLTLAGAMREAAPHLAEHERRVRLGRLLFEQERALEPIAHLSGGERVRAALALLLWRPSPPQLLLLDEPENNLDAASVERLVDALRGFRGAIVAVSHDRRFLDELGIETEVALAARVT